MVGNRLTSIAGYTSRVSELLESIQRLNESGLKPFTVKYEIPHHVESVSDDKEYREFILAWKARCEKQKELRYTIRHESSLSLNKNNNISSSNDIDLDAPHQIQGGGLIKYGDDIE